MPNPGVFNTKNKITIKGNLSGLKSLDGSGHFEKSDPDPDKKAPPVPHAMHCELKNALKLLTICKNVRQESEEQVG